jgi:hypothetical protein
MSRYPKLDFDRLQMFFREPFVIDLEDAKGTLTVYQPTIGDIVRIGEKKFYSTLNSIIGNTTQFRMMLWSVGFDWNEVTDFQLFIMLMKQLDADVLKLFFGDLDLLLFAPCEKQNPDGTKALVLYDEISETEISEDVYQYFHQYYQTVFNMHPEEVITKDKMLKKWYIDKDIREAKRSEEKKTDEKESILQPLISSYINHPGTKHSLQELKEVGVYEFFDSIKRLQIYESATALMKGMYSGMVDGKKIKPEEYNFMRA